MDGRVQVATGKEVQRSFVRGSFNPGTKFERIVQQIQPTWILLLLVWLATFFERLLDVIVPAPQRALQKAMSFIDSHVIFLSVKLGLAEAIGDEWKPVRELAHSLGLEDEALTRLLLAGEQIGFFRTKMKNQGMLVGNSRMSRILHEQHFTGLKPMFEVHRDETLPAFLYVEHALKSQHIKDAPTAFACYSGLPMWDFFDQHPHYQERFSRAMHAIDALGAKFIVADLKWKKFNRVVDIGGANGSLLAKILGKTSSSRGLLCDLAPVIANAKKVWKSDPKLAQLQSRVGFQDIDFMKPETLPRGKDGDCYVMRNIMHDWGDDEAKKILRNLRTAIGTAEATIAIVEMSPIERKRSPMCAAQRKADLIMMCMLKGKERDRDQWQSLLEASGFALSKIVWTRSPFYIVLGTPARSVDII